jgi:cGMP-dependent protein kinase 2
MEARDAGRINVLTESSPKLVEKGFPDRRHARRRAEDRCDRVIARMGSAAPRAFVESCGIQFSSEDRESFPVLSPQFETTAPGIFVIGALAGYPLIKHCMNQGYDVVEFINGNLDLKPADEPILEAKFKHLPAAAASTNGWFPARAGDHPQRNVDAADARVHARLRSDRLQSGRHRVPRNDPGSSLFAIAEGSLLVEISQANPDITVPIEQGSIIGEVGLISGRRRGATVRAAEPAILVEIPRNAALKLMATVPAAKRAITRISTERHAAADVRLGPHAEDLVEVLETAEIKQLSAGEAIIKEGEEGSTSSSSARARWWWRRISAASRSSSPICRPAPMSGKWR